LTPLVFAGLTKALLAIRRQTVSGLFDRIPGVGLPPGAIQIGKYIRYPDITGGLHTTAEGALTENQLKETDFSRGASGGCNQDPSKASGGSGNK